MIESKYLKDNIQNIQKLMSLTPFRKFETDKLRQLIRLSKIREYKPEETIIEEGGEDPYFWASKLHFYITGVTFYNFPYTFGYLLSRGLFSLFKKEGPDFLPKYEEFLRLTGSDTAENVARRSIGQDLESPDFWVESIRTLKIPFDKLKRILKS